MAGLRDAIVDHHGGDASSNLVVADFLSASRDSEQDDSDDVDQREGRGRRNGGRVDDVDDESSEDDEIVVY